MAKSATNRLKELNRKGASPTAGKPTRPRSSRQLRPPTGRPDDEVPVSWLNFTMVALIGLVAVLAASVFFGTRSIEGTLEAQASHLLAAAGYDQVEVDAMGTDLRLRGTYYEGDPIAETVAAIGRIEGVGAVDASQLYDIERPPESVSEDPTGTPINVAWSGGTVTLTGDMSSSDLRSTLIQSLRQAGGVESVDDTQLAVVEGIPSEAVWIDEMATLLTQAIEGLGEGSFFVNPSGRIFKVSGVTESRQLKNDIEETAELVVAASGFMFTPGVIVPRAEDAPTEEEVEELQTNLDELIEGKVVEFEGGSAELSAKGRALLDEIYDALITNPNVPVKIHGHASSDGLASTNQQLSEDRAAAVRDYLVGRGADVNRFIVVGHGDTQPIASNDTAEGRARNRRIEFEALLEEVVTEEETP